MWQLLWKIPTLTKVLLILLSEWRKYDRGYKKLLVVTGKGLRSKSHDNPYLSEKLSVLKYSVPEYIQNDENLSNKIIKISDSDIKDGGEGAIYIFLKNNKKFIG